jgi:NO-binding membrane sensor protein with MHYT domain
VALSGTHDSVLVTLSVVLAAVASYTALDLASRVRAATGWPRHAWLTAAAATMGGGIWSMHFVAMLAYSMPAIPVHYHLDLTLLSLAFPILVTGLAFYVVSRRDAGWRASALSGLVMGLSVVAMHYTGMCGNAHAG